MLAVNVVSIVLLLILSLIRFMGIRMDAITYYILHTAAEVTYLAPLWYLISILQYAGENISIQSPFSIFLGLELVNFLTSLFFTNILATLRMGIGVLTGILTIYMAINAFRVKNGNLAGPFKVLGIAFLLALLLKFSLGFIQVLPGRPLPSGFIGIMEQVPLFAILYLVYRTGKYLHETGIPSIGEAVINNN